MTNRSRRHWKKKYLAIFFDFLIKNFTLIFFSLFLLTFALIIFLIFRDKSPEESILSALSSSPVFSHAAVPNVEKISPNEPVALEAATRVALPSSIFGTFFDTFSGVGFVDLTKTTLYQDSVAHAIIFSPDYSWQPLETEMIESDQTFLKNIRFNKFEETASDERCLNNKCLEQAGNDLYYNNKSLARPKELKNLDVVAVSIGALEKRFLVGFTIKEGENYRGEVFTYDGSRFKALSPTEPFVSPYFGVFGFGGEENDFLVIYGAYKGIAYRFQGKNITDISHFFDIRVMNQGFKAEVVKTKKGNNTNWYVFSSTLKRPWFIKLWQNRTEEIVGEAIFKDLFASNEESAGFMIKEVSESEVVFLANVKRDSQDYWYSFIDRGFKNNEPGAVFLGPISHGLEPIPITFETLKLAYLDLDFTSRELIKFLFSTDGNEWQELALDKQMDFATPTIKQFYLQVTFPATADKFYSPFLDSVLFDYYYKK